MYTLIELRACPKTKAELAEDIYPDTTFDYALPQSWVDQHTEAFERLTNGARLIGAFVWLYDKQARTFGRPAPLYKEAADFLDTLPKY